MESARTFLFILFAFLTFLLYQAWQEDHKPAVVEKAPIESSLDSYLPTDTQSSSVATDTTNESSDDLSSQVPQSESGVKAETVISKRPIEIESFFTTTVSGIKIPLESTPKAPDSVDFTFSTASNLARGLSFLKLSFFLFFYYFLSILSASLNPILSVNPIKTIGNEYGFFYI